MKYKALIMDVDGTSVPNAVDGVPSPRVITAIAAAQKLIHVSVCTSRPLFIARDVIGWLGVYDPCGVNDATQIYDPRLKKVVKTFALPEKEIQLVSRFFAERKLRFMVNTGETEEYYTGGSMPAEVCSLCIPEIPVVIAMKLRDTLTATIPNISVQTPPSYKKGNVWISVTSATATKLHSVIEICERVGVKPEEAIGIGDGYNDFPLLSACGLKIAMGNAVPELKAIADFVAPTVAEDGVAQVIEKFILS